MGPSSQGKINEAIEQVLQYDEYHVLSKCRAITVNRVHAES